MHVIYTFMLEVLLRTTAWRQGKQFTWSSSRTVHQNVAIVWAMSHSWNLLLDDAKSLESKVAKLQSVWTGFMEQQVAACNTEVAKITESRQRQ